ncbi:hypothetical protein [Trinickia mobilis]|uniref:hypothetical protein n=1 Tax=Trinickia mobilis TaxID=2816356 RepID=UPI001A906F29|nr:hypothetical protein [Trinickia mobilis]
MKRLPEFRPPVVDEMRRMWVRYELADPDIHRLLLEIVRLRNVLDEVERLRQTIDRVWKADVGSQLVGLETLRCLLQQERVRIGILGRRAL